MGSAAWALSSSAADKQTHRCRSERHKGQRRQRGHRRHEARRRGGAAHGKGHSPCGRPLSCRRGTVLMDAARADTYIIRRVVSPHMCAESTPKGFPEPRLGSSAKGTSAGHSGASWIFTPWGPQPQTGSHRGTGVRGTGSAAGQHSTGGCGSSAVRRCGGAAAHCAGWGIAPVAWPLLHCCSRPPTPLLALQLALQQPIPPPLSSSADSSARQQLPARPAAAILARALILPQRRYAGFRCCYHCYQLSCSLCHDLRVPSIIQTKR